MTTQQVAETYHKYEVEPQLERRDVFQAVQQWASIRTVLYPGCSVHITPSFFFQHVVYVDRSPLAGQFFEDLPGITDFVSARKTYKPAPFIRFITHDYTTALPVRENSFDLLISLYAGGIAQACTPYLKVSGFLLSNNHHDDAGEAARRRDLRLAAVMHHKGPVCHLTDTGLENYFIPRKSITTRAHARYRSTRLEYTHRADYYLFEKVQAR